MVLPPELLSRSQDVLKNYSSTVSRFDQHTLCRFIDGGYLGRHLNRMKTLYRRRRDFLLELLSPHAQRLKLSISGGNAGLHLLVSGSAETTARILARAEERSIRVTRMSDYYHAFSGAETTIVLGYAGMNDETLSAAVSELFEGL